jgi:hypothetical protein
VPPDGVREEGDDVLARGVFEKAVADAEPAEVVLDDEERPALGSDPELDG